MQNTTVGCSRLPDFRFCLFYLGRGLGSLAPLGRPGLSPLGGGAIDPVPLPSGVGILGNGVGGHTFAKPKLGVGATDGDVNPLGGGLLGSGLGGHTFAKPKLGGSALTGGSAGALGASTISSPVARGHNTHHSNLYSTSPSHTSPVSSKHSSATNSPSSRSSNEGTTRRIKVLRMAVKYDPPTLALEYLPLKRSAGADDNKSKVHTFDLARLLPYDQLLACSGRGGNTTAQNAAGKSLATQLATKFPHYLATSYVPREQLERMIKKALSKGLGSAMVYAASAARNSSAAAPTTWSTAAPVASTAKPFSFGSGVASANVSRPASSTRSPTHSDYSNSNSSSGRNGVGDRGGSANGIEEDLEANGAQEEEQQEEEEELEISTGSTGSVKSQQEMDLNKVDDRTLQQKKAEMNKGTARSGQVYTHLVHYTYCSRIR
jgi:hypothetical protein